MPEQSYPEIATKSLSVRPEMPPFFASPLFAINGNKMSPFNFCYVGICSRANMFTTHKFAAASRID